MISIIFIYVIVWFVCIYIACSMIQGHVQVNISKMQTPSLMCYQAQPSMYVRFQNKISTLYNLLDNSDDTMLLMNYLIFATFASLVITFFVTYAVLFITKITMIAIGTLGALFVRPKCWKEMAFGIGVTQDSFFDGFKKTLMGGIGELFCLCGYSQMQKLSGWEKEFDGVYAIRWSVMNHVMLFNAKFMRVLLAYLIIVVMCLCIVGCVVAFRDKETALLCPKTIYACFTIVGLVGTAVLVLVNLTSPPVLAGPPDQQK